MIPPARFPFDGRRKSLAALLAVSALLSNPASVCAQETDIEAEHARGLALREAGQSEDAVRLFRALYDRTREPRALARLALAEGALGHWDLAAEHMELAVRARRDRWIRRNRRGLRENLSVILGHVGRAEVLCSTPGASLFVRGEQRAVLPMREAVRLPIGAVEIEVRAPGFVSARQTINITAGTTPQIVVALAAEPPPAPPAPPPPEPPPASIAPPAAAVVACPEGQFVTPDTAGHCCWPGQVFAATQDRCVGIPRCLTGSVARGEECVAAPSPEPVTAPPPPPPRRRETNRFQLSISGGYGFQSDVLGGTIGGRLGYSIVGHVYVGVTGGYTFGEPTHAWSGATTYMGTPASAAVGERSGWFVGPELGIEFSPGHWILRASLAAVYRLSTRFNGESFRRTDPNWPFSCSEPNLTLMPGASILAPLTEALYLGIDVRYAVDVYNFNQCFDDNPLRFPSQEQQLFLGTSGSNNGVIVTGEFGLRL